MARVQRTARRVAQRIAQWRDAARREFLRDPNVILFERRAEGAVLDAAGER